MADFRVYTVMFTGFFIMTLFSLFLVLIEPKPDNDFPVKPPRHPRAYIIGIDGIGNLPKTVETPGIHRVIYKGIYTFEAKTVHPSLSVESWTSLLHGVEPAKHKMYTKFEIEDNKPKFKEPKNSFPLTSEYPSIYRLIHENHKDAKMACFSNWEFIPKYIIEDNISVHKYYNKSEELLVEAFEKYMESNDPWLVFFQLDDTDEAGHKYGFFSDEQKKQLVKTDSAVSKIIDIIEKYDRNDEDLIIIQTDHGGGGDYFAENKMERPSFICEKCMHGSKDPKDMTIFWTARGKTICKFKRIEQDVSIRDTAKFVAIYLGLLIPDNWDGYDLLYPENQCD